MKQSKLSTLKTNIIGITGGVGAGKSTILDYIKENYNARVIYSDQVANDIKKRGYPAYNELVELLGREVLDSDLEIDKAKMAEAIFQDKTLLDKVNNVLHPAVNTFIISIIDKERTAREHDFVIDNSSSESEAFKQIDNKLGEWKKDGKFRTAGSEGSIRT